MPKWNGQDLEKGTPTLGFTLSSAMLIPGFVEQALGLPLFAHVNDTLLTPLDDVKEWMRSDPYREGQLFETVGDLLMGEERKARKAADKAGVPFDLVAYELEQLVGDKSYESFDPAWTGTLLRLVIEEADALQAWSRREHGVDFALSTSFQLWDPRKNPVLSRETIAAGLASYGNMAAAEGLLKDRRTTIELGGGFQLDLTAPGKAPDLKRGSGVGFVLVPCADQRSGDETQAWLSLAYPLASEGYFLTVFDALRQELALKKTGEEA